MTSGDIETCTPDNTYFDLLLDNFHETVLWVVPEDMPDELEYYCIYTARSSTLVASPEHR